MTPIEFTDYTPPSWNIWLMQGVYWVATKSKDLRTKIGAIIVKDKRILSTGYNGLPSGVKDDITDRLVRPDKYKWFEHGERNAIFAAAKHGINIDGASLYTNGIPCADCARGIIQSGISEVYVHKQFNTISESNPRDQWKEHDSVTFTMFNEANVKVFAIDAVLGVKAYFDGKKYDL